MRRVYASVALLFALSACAGGGGSTSSIAAIPTTTNNADATVSTSTVSSRNGSSKIVISEYTLPNGILASAGVTIAHDGSIWTGAANHASFVRLQGTHATMYAEPSSSQFDPAAPDMLASTTNGRVWGSVHMFPTGLSADQDAADIWTVAPGASNAQDVANLTTIRAEFWGVKDGADGSVWGWGNSGNGSSAFTRVDANTLASQTLQPPGFPPQVGPLAVGPDGNMWGYVSEANGGTFLYRYNASGQSLSTVPLPGQFPLPSDMVTGPDHNLWATAGNVILRITSQGAITSYPISSGSNAQSIAVGGDGALWFTDSGTNAVGRISTSGAVSEFTLPTPNAGPAQLVGIESGCGPSVLWLAESLSGKLAQVVIH